MVKAVLHQPQGRRRRSKYLKNKEDAIASGGESILSQPSADSSLCGGSLLGAASADAGFRLCGREAVDGARLAAFRSPPPPLRAPTYKQ